MVSNQEAAALSCHGAFLQATGVLPPSQHRIGWSAFFLIALFPSLLVALPTYGSVEQALSSENFLLTVNRNRMSQGLQPLRQSQKLQEAARAKAQNMLREGYFSHNSPAGITPWDFIKLTGFSYQFAGENLAMNYTDPQELLQDFLLSPTHRENILSPLFSETGIAVIAGQYQGTPAIITVQMFADPAESEYNSVDSVNRPVAVNQ